MSRSYDIVNNIGIWTLLAVLAFLPVYGPWMAYAEGHFFPVTSKVSIIEERPAQGPDGGINIRFAYHKYRACEIVSTTMKRGEQDVGFTPVNSDANSAPTTRLPGQQISRLWHVDANSLEGLEMWFVHRCSLLWLTATQVLP